VPRIRVSTTIPAPPGAVWEAVSDLASHADWMADAESVHFTTRRRSGRRHDDGGGRPVGPPAPLRANFVTR
jgi:uncharacterized protein YndB with AHSA1/START domain